jgi:hypothetical protein
MRKNEAKRVKDKQNEWREKVLEPLKKKSPREGLYYVGFYASFSLE